MKSNIKALLIVLIFISNTGISISSQISRSHSVSTGRSKVSGGWWIEIKNQLETRINAKNVFNFVLGFMASWIPAIKKAYDAFIAVYDPLKECFDTAKFVWKKLTKDDVKDISNIKNSWYNMAPEKKRDFCESVQKEIKDNYKKYKKLVKDYGVAGMNLFIINEECKIYNEKREDRESWETMCNYFKKMDCKKFAETTSDAEEVIGVIEKGRGYLDTVISIKNCIGTIMKTAITKVPSAFKEILKNVLKDIANWAANSTVGKALQAFTLGVWGGIKGSYYLVKLGRVIYQIYKFLKKGLKLYEDKSSHIYFQIGELLGTGVRALKSYLTGRKK